MDGYSASTYGDAFADVYDDWYDDISPAAETAAFVAARVRGTVLELGSGTGRLAEALRALELDVLGIDASSAMLGRSRARCPDVPVIEADMCSLPVAPGRVAGVLCAYNTLFNVPTEVGQISTLRECARIIDAGGVVVLEAFVPGDGAAVRSDAVDVVRVEPDVVVLRVARTDPDARTVTGHHVELRDAAPVRLRPWKLRYSSPAELDRMAGDAGLVLAERFADWLGTSFDQHCANHVSVYRRR